MDINEVKVKLFSLLLKVDPNNISDIDVDLISLLSKDEAIQSVLDVDKKPVEK